MNSHKTIIILLIIFLLIGSGVAYFIYQNSQAPITSNGTPVTNELPSVPPPNLQTKVAVQAAFLKHIEGRNNDNIKVFETAIVGSYALQVWVGNIMGGEALLKYDGVQNSWVVLTMGGGAWSVGSLVETGVPRDTATALLAGIPQ